MGIWHHDGGGGCDEGEGRSCGRLFLVGDHNGAVVVDQDGGGGESHGYNNDDDGGVALELFAIMVMVYAHDDDVVGYDNDNLRASQVCGRKQLEGTVHHDLLWVSDKGNFEVPIIMIFSYNA